MQTVHVSVLSQEVISMLALQDGDTVVDATAGGGGHSEGILRAAATRVIAFDADPAAIARVTERLGTEASVTYINANFRRIRAELQTLGITEVQAVLFDLGLSSDELEVSGRGFSFKNDEPLLMTFDPAQELTAKDLLSYLSAEDLTNILKNYGDERYAKRIAEAIVVARATAPIETTFALVDVIKGAVPASYRTGRIHPATKTFQALRIAVNDEMDALREGLLGAWESLANGGRLVVISFHSLEDRIVKDFMKTRAKEEQGVLLTKKPIVPTREEALANPRARSAKLRGILKTV